MRSVVVHVGLHKTATTWLQNQVFSKAGTLANDFIRPDLDPLVRALVLGEGTPPRLGDGQWVVSAERLSGHPASGWFDADDIAQRIADWEPGAKILVGTRDPEAWQLSLHKQLVSEGSLERFRSVTSRGWKMPYMATQRVTPAALRERYESRFEQVHYLRFEQLEEDPETYLSELFEFLDIDALDVDMTPRNVQSHGNIELKRILNFFRESEYNPDPLLGGHLYSIGRRLARRARRMRLP